MRDQPQPLHSRYWGVVRRCLEKDPARRFATAAEARQAIEDAGAARRLRGNWMRSLAAAAALAAIGAGLWLARRLPSPGAPSAHAVYQVTMDAGLNTDPTLSSDGKLLAYASDRSSAGNLEVWAQPIGSGPVRRLTSGRYDHHEPAISPDAREIRGVDAAMRG